MPYIKNKHRIRHDAQDMIVEQAIQSAGELNYLITKLIKRYLSDKGESYQSYNDIMGAMEGAKLEMYRRLVAPYEDKKIKENGDVY